VRQALYFLFTQQEEKYASITGQVSKKLGRFFTSNRIKTKQIHSKRRLETSLAVQFIKKSADPGGRAV
jgi:hypothetical protein